MRKLVGRFQSLQLLCESPKIPGKQSGGNFKKTPHTFFLFCLTNYLTFMPLLCMWKLISKLSKLSPRLTMSPINFTNSTQDRGTRVSRKYLVAASTFLLSKTRRNNCFCEWTELKFCVGVNYVYFDGYESASTHEKLDIFNFIGMSVRKLRKSIRWQRNGIAMSCSKKLL